MSQKITIQDVARKIARDASDNKDLVYIKNIDCFAKYNFVKNYFEILNNDDFLEYIFKLTLMTDLALKNVSPSMVKDIAKLVVWFLNKKSDDIITDYVAIKDGVINLNTFEIEEPDKDKNVFFFINTTKKEIEKGYDPNDLFIRFIYDVIVDKDKKPHQPTIDVVQEMFGYYLLNTLDGHTSFFLNGKGANGKSVVLSILREMIGKDFMTSMTVQDLTTDTFATSTLIGKKVNICNEDESKFTKSDKFKAMISGDPITVRRMYQPGFSWKPTVKYIFSTNDMPTFSGVGEALIRRIKIIPFNYKVPEELRIPKLDEKICRNMGVIVAWALEGAKRLKKNKFVFSKSELIDAKMEEFKENLSATILFFKENYITSESNYIDDDELYESYKIWCAKRGKKVQNFYTFIKDIENNLKLGVVENASTGKKSRLIKIRYDETEPRLPDF